MDPFSSQTPKVYSPFSSQTPKVYYPYNPKKSIIQFSSKTPKFIPYFHPKRPKNIFPMHCIGRSLLIPGQRVVLQQRKRFPKATLPLSRSFFWCSGKISSNNFFLSVIIFISFISCQWYQSKLLYDNHKAQSQANLFWFFLLIFLSISALELSKLQSQLFTSIIFIFDCNHCRAWSHKFFISNF